jgi:putative endonuclease
MPFFVYVLKSEKNGRSYTGHTKHLDIRIAEHNTGKNKATKHIGPWRLVYHEEYPSRAEAMAREKYFKSQPGRIELRTRGFL